MKNVCDSCKFAKRKGDGIYCVKYGIIIYKERVYCVAYERDSEVRKSEDRGRWD